MQRVSVAPRSDWQQKARTYGFRFHSMYGQPYWDESAYYRFGLRQVEDGVEAVTAELHRMCLAAVGHVVQSEELLSRFAIPSAFHDAVRASWERGDATLYSRLDLSWDGVGPARLLENNADTPTSLYETGFWQWLWLEDLIAAGALPAHADQFNSLQEQLIERLAQLARMVGATLPLHVSCCRGSEEDRGTVQYLQDCAHQAGVATRFVHIEDLGEGIDGSLTDLDDNVIRWMFKLYPWEFLMRDEAAALLPGCGVRFIEPWWKAVVANKAILAVLWELFPGHPNLLPAWFEADAPSLSRGQWVRKPMYSREGANVVLLREGQVIEDSGGPYGSEGCIVQAWHPLPVHAGRHVLVGSWLVGDQPAGMSIREDVGPITRDLSRFVPHALID